MVSPRAADTIRKLSAYLVAGVGTVFLLRVMFKLANGKAYWTDPELWAFLALAALMIWWVVAAKHVRRAAMPKQPETDEDPPAL